MLDSKQPLEAGLVSVVIANYNGAAHLDDCLNSLKDQTYGSIEIEVIDNGSTDQSGEICARHGVPMIYSGGNLGLAPAYNFGVQRSRGEFAFVANNDIWLAPDCIERLVQAMNRRGQSCFAADPKQYSWDRTTIIHYRGALRPLKGPRELVSGFFSALPPRAMTYTRSEQESVVPFASAGAMMVRRGQFEELGGFDPTFFMDWEDVDLCWRAARRGWDSVFVPAAWIRHKWQATNSAISRKSTKLTPIGFKLAVSQQHNLLRFALKNYDLSGVAALVVLRCGANLLYPFRRRAYYSRAGIHAMTRICFSLAEILRLRRAIARSATISNRQLFRRFQIGPEPFNSVWANEDKPAPA